MVRQLVEKLTKPISGGWIYSDAHSSIIKLAMQRYFSRSAKVFIIFLAAWIVTACTTTRATTDYEQTYDFTSFKSFFVLPVDKKVYDNPLVSELEIKRIERLIVSELGKSYKQSEKVNADFFVRYYLVVDKQMSTKTYDTRFGIHHGYGYYYGDPHVKTSYYNQGSIIVDVLDAKNDEVVWRGVTKGRMQEKLSPSERELRMKRILSELFTNFPPK